MVIKSCIIDQKSVERGYVSLIYVKIAIDGGGKGSFSFCITLELVNIVGFVVG
jgi:hypothetical protein